MFESFSVIFCWHTTHEDRWFVGEEEEAEVEEYSEMSSVEEDFEDSELVDIFV